MKTKTEPKTETAKHTPGPWIMEDFGEVRIKGLSGFRALEGSQGEPITRLVRDNSPEGLANAQLIAAAPELLEALRWLLVRSVNLDQSVTADGLENCDAIANARAAIAKAEGRAT